MIYRLVSRSITEISGRWTSLRDAVRVVREHAEIEYPAPRSTAQQAIVDELLAEETQCDAALASSQAFETTIPTMRGALVPLLAQTQTFLTGSLADLNTDYTDNTGTRRAALRTALRAITFPADSDAAAALRAAVQLADELDAGLEECVQDVEELQLDEGARANLAEIRRSVTDQTAYPILTRETSGTTNGSGGGNGYHVATSQLGNRVDSALREVLGWRPRTTDGKGFAAAVAHSFTTKHVDGETVVLYEPRSYTVQADVGAVTGAQASIYTRARVAMDQSKPMLHRIEPLRPDFDEEDVAASRAIVQAQLQQLVDELGQQGGPRVQRVEALFEQMLGVTAAAPAPDPDTVAGSLGDFRDELGLTLANVGTVDEERRVTDFVTVLDYVPSLRASWQTQSRYFDRTGSDVYLGTQLVLLGRALAVVAESAREVAAALDSVFLGAAERQTIRLLFGPGQPPLFVAELLSWVEHFAGEEARDLIKEGRSGVRALFPTIERLRDLTQQACTREFGGIQTQRGVPAGYCTARVQRSLLELADHCREVVVLATPFRT